MKRISSADLIQYNANNRGTHTGDCVRRSLSLALGMSYHDLATQLDAFTKENFLGWKYNNRRVYMKWLQDNFGLTREPVPEEYKTLSDFVDAKCTKGTWLVETGNPKKTGVDHIVCVKDGNVFDSWNSLDESPKYFIAVPDNLSKPVNTEVSLGQFRDQYSSWIEAQIDKLSAKYGWAEDMGYKWKVSFKTQFNARISITFELPPCEYVPRERKYAYNFGITISPQIDPNTLEKKVHETLNTRIYDRMYSVNQAEMKLVEADTVRRASGQEEYTDFAEDNWISEFERRSINQLPGWVRPLIKFVDFQDPGKYHDSYTLRIAPLPGSKAYGDKENFPNGIRFEAYTADQLKDMLRRYKSKDEIPDIDYIVEEDY